MNQKKVSVDQYKIRIMIIMNTKFIRGEKGSGVDAEVGIVIVTSKTSWMTLMDNCLEWFRLFLF